MRAEEITVGVVYWVKVSGKLAPCRVDCKSTRGGFDVTNLNTNRKIRLRSAGRIRREVSGVELLGLAIADQSKVAKAFFLGSGIVLGVMLAGFLERITA
ncbi:MAG: hypothetical protein JSW58_08555 [Candidatus Latescibacterota bacterium]|nr:MAG: hypothetical protein JSW58_08555 [Candidatus Latescibacterota bacterium]